MKQVEPQQGARTDRQPEDGTGPRLTRTQAAADAGLSGRQRQTALRTRT